MSQAASTGVTRDTVSLSLPVCGRFLHSQPQPHVLSVPEGGGTARPYASARPAAVLAAWLIRADFSSLSVRRALAAHVIIPPFHRVNGQA